MNFTDIFRTFPPKAAEYTFFSSSHGTFSRIDHILGHKSAFNKYKKIEIIPCIFSGHNSMKLEVNHKKIFGKTTNTWSLKNILLKNEWRGGEWVCVWGNPRMTQLVEHLTLTQVMILQFVGLSPVLGSVPTVQSLKPASDSVSLALCPPLSHSLSLSLKNE